MATTIKKHHLFIFALPAMVSAIMHGPIVGIVPALYAREYGLDLALIGTVLLVARIFDAVTDPMIGFLSDRTTSRYGKRKSWIVGGAMLTTVSVYFLYTPGESSTMVYFLSFTLLLYFAWTLMEIPYTAWLLEMSRETEQRTRLNAARIFALLAGGILFYLAPQFVPESGGRMDFAVLGLIAWFCVFMIPITTFLMVKFVPEGDVYKTSGPPKLRELWGSIRGNRPFKFFLGMYVFIGLASGVSGGLSFLYVDSYLDIGDRFTELFLPALFISPLVLPVWVWVLNKFGKVRTTFVAFVIYTLIMPLPWFIEPGDGAFVGMLIYFVGLSLFSPLLMVSMPSIMGDIIDHDELATGKNRAGQYNSFLALIAKGMGAVGTPMGLLLVGLFGYQPGVENDVEAIEALRLVYNFLPVVIIIPGLYLLLRFPITEADQRETKARLEARAQTANNSL